MKTLKKLAVGAALLGAITTAQAEQMIFGAVVEPIMSLEVDGRILPAEALLSGVAAAAPAAANPTVGSFRIITNVIKWNVKMSLSNAGVLKTWSGNVFKTKLAGAAAVTNGALGVSTTPLFICPTDNNGTAVACDPAGIAAAANIVAVSAANAAVPTGADIIGRAPTFPATGTAGLVDLAAVATYTESYFYNIQKNALTFEVHSLVGGDEVASLAGTYTETLNMSLYGSY